MEAELLQRAAAARAAELEAAARAKAELGKRYAAEVAQANQDLIAREAQRRAAEAEEDAIIAAFQVGVRCCGAAMIRYCSFVSGQFAGALLDQLCCYSPRATPPNTFRAER